PLLLVRGRLRREHLSRALPPARGRRARALRRPAARTRVERLRIPPPRSDSRARTGCGRGRRADRGDADRHDAVGRALGRDHRRDKHLALRPAAAAARPHEDGVSRPRLLVLNQYYRPGPEATAQLLAELCDGLADEFEITVVTGRVRGSANADRPVGE